MDGSMFKSSNFTPLIQPMDQNIIKLTKIDYRKYLLSIISRNLENLREEKFGRSLKLSFGTGRSRTKDYRKVSSKHFNEDDRSDLM